MILYKVLFGISVVFMSWIIGMIINSILVKTEWYKKISNLNFIKSKSLNKIIGMNYFKWIVKNSFFKFFNQKISLNNKKTDLVEIRKEMTFAEISHLIAFGSVTVIAINIFITQNFLFALIIMIVNIVMNLFPSLLQQQNKRRIDVLIKKQSQSFVNASFK